MDRIYGSSLSVSKPENWAERGKGEEGTMEGREEIGRGKKGKLVLTPVKGKRGNQPFIPEFPRLIDAQREKGNKCMEWSGRGLIGSIGKCLFPPPPLSALTTSQSKS